MRYLVGDTEVGLVVEDNGRGCSSGGSSRNPLPLFEEILLSDLVDDILGGSEHDG